jgi:pimeloyl-ACP methyl ester carboxylesterase
VHEQLLIDLAVAHGHLAKLGFQSLYFVGNSGGAGLYGFYLQQAALPPEGRVTSAPSGLQVDLLLTMPSASGLVLVAPHPGQGELLLHSIDPSVADELDPGSVRPDLDMFDPANGFNEPPQSASYKSLFLNRYREAQRERVSRIDALMLETIRRKAGLRRSGKDGDARARRLAMAPSFFTIYRTDADPRTVDLSLDPSDRDYGSIFGHRPDVTNYGAIGFGRLTTPDAWLSTWSGISSRASLYATSPAIDIPTLIVYYTADNSVFPGEVSAIHKSLGAKDKVLVETRADHFGFVPGSEQRASMAAEMIVDWLDNHR